MNGRYLILGLAVCCGLGAMFGARQMLKRSSDKPRTVDILVAAQDLKVEQVLTPEDVKVAQVPASAVPAGSFASYKDVAERWVKIPTLAGEPIVDAKLGLKGAPTGMVPRIPDGMRAYAIKVDEQSGVGGFILPDHHVDVILSRSRREAAKRPQAETILQNILVLAAGTTITHPEDKAIQVRTVTLALTPEDAEIVTAAQGEGSLSLALRGFNDNELTEHRPPAELPPDPEEEPAPVVVLSPPEPAPEPPPAPVAVVPPPSEPALVDPVLQPVQAVAALAAPEPPRRTIVIHHGPSHTEQPNSSGRWTQRIHPGSSEPVVAAAETPPVPIAMPPIAAEAPMPTALMVAAPPRTLPLRPERPGP